MLTFYRRGERVAVVHLGELFADRSFVHLRPARYEWGRFVGFVGLHRFAVDTVEQRRLTYDVTSGKQIEARPLPVPDASHKPGRGRRR